MITKENQEQDYFKARVQQLFWISVLSSIGGAVICTAGTIALITTPIWILPAAAILNHKQAEGHCAI